MPRRVIHLTCFQCTDAVQMYGEGEGQVIDALRAWAPQDSMAPTETGSSPADQSVPVCVRRRRVGLSRVRIEYEGERYRRHF